MLIGGYDDDDEKVDELAQEDIDAEGEEATDEVVAVIIEEVKTRSGRVTKPVVKWQ
jgi:hypothetical protein